MKQNPIQTVFKGGCEIKNPCWWYRRTRLEKWLIVGFATALALCAATFAALVLISLGKDFKSGRLIADETTSYPTGVCLTKGCVKAASHIIESLDTTVSPCDDFYEFSCGGWKKSKYIHDDQTGITEFGALRDSLNRKLRILVEKESPDNEPKFFKMMRTIYKQCMNLTKIEAYQAKPLIKDIIRVGGWPVVEGIKWNATHFNWLNTLLKFRRLGFNHNIFVAIFIGPDVKNSTRHVAQIDQPSLGLPNRKYLVRGLNDSVVKAYYNMMVDTAITLGAKNRTRVEAEMMDVLVFETKLANMSLPMEERRNFTLLYNKMTLRDVKVLAPYINWEKLVNGIFMHNITDSEEFVVKVPQFVKFADSLLKSTDSRVLANYMSWRLVFSTFAQLGMRWRKLSEKYDKALTGKGRERPRWDTCMRRLYGSFGVPMSSMYVKEYFDTDSRLQAQEMVHYIHGQFIHILQNVDWMDEETKLRAIEKADAITSHIGYSKEILVKERVMELYEGLDLPENVTFYQNVQTLRAYWTDYDIKKLRKPYNKNDWKKFSQAATINAFYNSLENSIKFPAGILQGVFFNKNRPNYLNYGAIGYIIGHEITHGFDDRGRQFDKDGNNRNWWKPETDEKFKEKARCIIEQYGNFTIPDSSDKLNGVNTQGENIADNGGLKQAFMGYQKYVRENGAEPKLPGLKYSPNQLFWISAANVWCANIRPQALKLRLQTGVHSPPRYRVVGPMINLPQFADSFNCPRGSAMNPIKKCSIW